MRAARRRREAQAARDRGLLQPRSWSEDELERDAATGGHGYGYGYGYGYDYAFGWCDDSDCSSCDGAGGPADDESDGGIAGNWADLDAGGHASDPGTGAGVEGRARRARSDTIRSRRAGRAAAAGRRGTLVSGGAHEPLGGQAGGQQQRRRRHPTLSAAEEEQRVLETSRRETRMVRAAEWDEVRKLWEARWGVERVKDEIAGERAAVERVLGSEEDGWAAQVRRWRRCGFGSSIGADCQAAPAATFTGTLAFGAAGPARGSRGRQGGRRSRSVRGCVGRLLLFCAALRLHGY